MPSYSHDMTFQRENGREVVGQFNLIILKTITLKWYILTLSEMIFWNCKDTFENKIEYPEHINMHNQTLTPSIMKTNKGRLSSRQQRSKQHKKSPKALSSEMRYTC